MIQSSGAFFFIFRHDLERFISVLIQLISDFNLKTVKSSHFVKLELIAKCQRREMI